MTLSEEARAEEVSGMWLFRSARAASLWLVARANIRSERGATAVEYAIMVALIAAVIVIAVILLGRASSSTYSTVGDCVDRRNALNCPP